MFSGVGILVLHNFETNWSAHNQIPDLKLLCKEAGFEVGLDDNLHLQLGPAHLSHQGNHSERQGDVLCGAVPENQVIELEHSCRSHKRIVQEEYSITSSAHARHLEG